MSDNLRKDPQVILCDMCTEDRRPARKTCMKCEISMCVQHLQTHLTTPVLRQTHPLTEPMASGDGGLVGTTKCPQHGKLLEYYCLDDLICVCVSCAIEDQHSKHNMKTFSTAHKQLMEKVKAAQQDLQVKTDDESVSLEKWEKSEREKLGRSSVRLIEAVTNLRDIALTSVQSSVSARMVSIRTSKSSLQAAEKEKDTFRFLQMYSQVHQDVEKAKAVDLRKGLEPGSDRDKLVQEIKQKGENMMEQASAFWGSLLTHVDPENYQEVSATSSDLFFDPQTLDQGVTLSKDKRKVFYSGLMERCTLLIQGTKSSTASNIHRWVISLSKDCDWTVGLCDKNYAKELNNGDVFGLSWKGNKLNSLTTEHHEVANVDPFRDDPFQEPNRDKGRRVSLQVISPPDEDKVKQVARPEEVEVVWRYPNSLSFYNLSEQHQRRKIVTITTSSRSRHLTPFVCLEADTSQNSSTEVQHMQKRWKCSCGRGHPGNMNTYKCTCCCGGVIPFLHFTEVLCELL
uniref:tripartite motif-containing protein 16-like n=1 Tax=Semicossyphus pulcher TaxID=241346 RepID=UPI0037E74E33